MLAATDQAFYGTIKSYNAEKGWGHIECDQTRQIYGKDMFVLRSQLSGARVDKGDQVEFRVRQGQQGPEATAVRVLSSQVAQLPAVAMAPVAPDLSVAGGLAGLAAPAPGAPAPGAPCWAAAGAQAWSCPGGVWVQPATTVAPAAPAPAVALPGVAPAAPPPAMAAVPAAAAAPAAGPFFGMVRGWVPERGYGYIQSDQSQQIFGRDILLLHTAVTGGFVQEGDTVRFSVRMEQEGPVAAEEGDTVRFSVRMEQEGPVAAEVQVISTAAGTMPPQWVAQPLPPPGYAWPTAVPGAPAWGTAPAAMAAPAAALPAAALPPGAAVPPGGALLPCVAPPPSGTGLPAGAECLPPGAATMPNGTAPPPLWAATGLPPEWGACPQYGQAPCAGGFGAHLWGAQATPVPYVPPTPEKQVYYGVVKAFDEEKGWGHISCDVTRQVYGKDMFVLRSSLHGTKISAGDEVQFTLRQGLRGVEATEVRPLSRVTTTASPDEAFPAEGAMQAGQPEATGREFVGTLKMFDNTKGWGFLECDESRQLYGKDIFVHKREFPKGCTPDNGDRLRFVVERGRDARPEARRVSLDDPTAAIAGMAPIAALTDVATVGADVAGATVVAGAAQLGPELPPLGPELPQYGAARTPDIGPAERVAPY